MQTGQQEQQNKQATSNIPYYPSKLVLGTKHPDFNMAQTFLKRKQQELNQ